VLGGNLHEQTNWTWFFSFVAALVILVIISLVFRSLLASLFKGKDGRTSTSKTQALLWTYAVVFALLALLMANVIVAIGHAVSPDTLYLALPRPKSHEHTLAGNVAVPFANFVKSGLNSTYFFLLGLPLGGAIAAKAITSTKVANGSVVKQPKDKAPDETKKNAVQEIVVDDEGSTDLGDFQYFLLGLVALLYFLSQFLIHPARGLPEMPDTLVALTSVSAAAYVTKKGLHSDPPVLLSVSPPKAAPGDKVHIYGDKLLASPVTDSTRAHAARELKPDGAGELKKETEAAQAALDKARGSVTVLFGSAVASPLQPDGQDVTLAADHLVVEVPESVAAGATSVSVVRPPGARSEALPFEVTGAKPVIFSVVPNTLKRGQAITLRITGRNFTKDDTAGQGNAVTLGGVMLDPSADGWKDGYVAVLVPESSVEAGSQSLVVYDDRGRPSDGSPVTVTE
jgi:hypothetical protein